jgi:hypothetical protein
MAGRLSWPPIVARAAEIVLSYDIPVTLRQLFYRLVMEQLIPHTDTVYKTLSAQTAELRRNDEFPRLFDRGRKILQSSSWEHPADAMQALVDQYRLDRTIGQDTAVYIGVEKNALAGLLQAWFDELGLPVLPLGGYASVSLERIVRDRVQADGRPAVLIYAGDFDASGMNIGEVFVDKSACWKEVIRLGLDEDTIDVLDLPVLKGKASDARAPKFIDRFPAIHARHNFGTDDKGRRYPVQVELDAVDPVELHRRYRDALAPFWDTSAYEGVLAQEDVDRAQLARTISAL